MKVYHQPVKSGSKSIQLAATLMDSTLPITFFSHDACLPHEGSTEAMLVKTFIFIITKYFPFLLFPFSLSKLFRPVILLSVSQPDKQSQRIGLSWTFMSSCSQETIYVFRNLGQDTEMT